MEHIVVDANVLVKWFVEEDYTDKALLLRDDHIGGCAKIIIPIHALLEVGDALRKYAKLSYISPNDAIEALNILTEFNLTIVDIVKEALTDAISYSIENSITLYDAYYVILARRKAARFYTADEKLLKKLSRLEPHAYHLKHYKKKCTKQ